MSSTIFSIITFVYLLSSLLYLCYLVFSRKDWLGKAATFVTIVGLMAHTAAIILRWVESYQMGIGHAPLSNMFESLVFFAWSIALLYVIFEYKYKNRALGTFVMPFAFFTMLYAALAPNFSTEIQPLLPALQSNWLIAHVVTCFLAYAAFAVSCGAGIMYFLRDKTKDKGGGNSGLTRFLPPLEMLDDLIYRVVIIGFILLAVGIATGAMWANSAWGAYWSWDPKETWSLITWFVYATLLHARFVHGWRGRKVALLSIIGFGAVLFTYFGVSYLLSGLHSYAT
ncbi:MAG TPA: c-type cytochrome biogenesis protein CcsB [Syntrophaceae bacterium]|nr:c-type cytochrome biogenesis protein CcsB [Syntrophaceae bacterium]